MFADENNFSCAVQVDAKVTPDTVLFLRLRQQQRTLIDVL